MTGYDTPITDAVIVAAGELPPGTPVVYVHHMRKLERELTDLKRQVADLKFASHAFAQAMGKR